MAFLLNYGQFYQRLRELLQNNHSVSKYKFGNKVNGAMKDFDTFLDNTVKKYMDAFNAIHFIKEENVQLRVLNERLKKQLKQSSCEQQFLRLQLEQRDAICYEMIAQKEKLHEMFLYSIKDNPVFIQAKRLRFQVAELKEEKQELLKKFEVEKTKNQLNQKQMRMQIEVLQQKLTQYIQDYTELEKEHEEQLKQSQQSMNAKLSSERKVWQQAKMKQQLSWRRQMQALTKKKQAWKQKYYEQVGFIALTQESEDSKTYH